MYDQLIPHFSLPRVQPSASNLALNLASPWPAGAAAKYASTAGLTMYEIKFT
jgi:hypothetical protein